MTYQYTGKYKGLYSRWYRFDENGNKHIKRFPIDFVPENNEWHRGTGPLNPEHRKNVTNALKRQYTGVPKSVEQREKMSKAKLGKPKTEEHKQSMRDAWKRRRKLIAEQNRLRYLKERGIMIGNM
jgi:hypothetical protein